MIQYRELVDQQEMVDKWPKIYQHMLHLLRRYPEYYEPDGSGIIRAMLQGKLHALIAEEGEDIKMVCLVEFQDFPRGKSFRILELAGSWLPKMDEAFDWLFDWAKDRGATFAEFWGRKGFWKYLKRQGFQIRQLNFTRPL